MPSRSPTVIEQSTSLPDQNFFRNQCKKSENKDNTRTEYFQAYTLFNKQNSFNSSKKSSSTSALQRQHHQLPITDERIHFILLRQREPLAYRQPSPAASLITNRNCDFCTSRREALQKMRLPDVYRKKIWRSFQCSSNCVLRRTQREKLLPLVANHRGPKTLFE